jgi:hypothetical protein
MIRPPTGFGSVIWLLLRGDLPSPVQAALLEAALVAGLDHGPHAPSVAIAWMAATCGLARWHTALASRWRVRRTFRAEPGRAPDLVADRGEAAARWPG